ncbi:MAG: site-specific DNA-methyltransferase, partial [Rickettsiales bacterium]|nr:site-specific DNA-methyltransferase [Rickettsiales bacterium]
MTNKQDFINVGFEVIDTSLTSNRGSNLLEFLQEHYPQIIQDGEIKLNELKQVLNLPIDYKNNGYGLNFIGRNYAKAKYVQATNKEPKINQKLSKDFNETDNVIIKGDNLDSLKILLNSYRGKIKCIYIDPPYNTKNEGFIYSDKFDREELAVLGFENINDDDYRRMEFSFSNKSSHNGWLSFIYPRLKLARDLLANDGVIFVSIDDGEENFVACLPRNTTTKGKNDEKQIANSHDYVLVYAKLERFSKDSNFKSKSRYRLEDNIGKYYCEAPLDSVSLPYAKNLDFEINFNGKKFNPIVYNGNKTSWRWSQDLVKFGIENNLIVEKENRLYSKTYLEYEIKKQNGEYKIIKKQIGGSFKSQMLMNYKYGNNEAATQLKNFGIIFDYSKPSELIQALINLVPENENITILDFFAGSGTTAQAVMELNKKDGGNRKFILCQIDELI